MSHIVSIKTKVQDVTAITAACQRLGLAAPTQGSTRLFSGQVSGLLVKLPDWLFPLVIDTTSGEIQFDNYGGHWGEQAQLDHFLQAYVVEKARLEARKKGYQVREESLQDGSVKLQIIEGA